MDCLNPLLSRRQINPSVESSLNMSQPPGKVDILTHLSPNALCFCLSDPGPTSGVDFRGPTDADRGAGEPLDRGGVLGPLNKFELFLSGRRCW